MIIKNRSEEYNLDTWYFIVDENLNVLNFNKSIAGKTSLVVELENFEKLKRKIKLFGVWHGKWRSDVFDLDPKIIKKRLLNEFKINTGNNPLINSKPWSPQENRFIYQLFSQETFYSNDKLFYKEFKQKNMGKKNRPFKEVINRKNEIKKFLIGQQQELIKNFPDDAICPNCSSDLMIVNDIITNDKDGFQAAMYCSNCKFKLESS